MTVIAVVCDKGGSGKTTTATTLAQRLAQLGETWLLDFDSQGHCGLCFGLEPAGGLYDWLGRGYDVRRCLQNCRPPGFMVLPSDPRTRNIELKLAGDRLGGQRIVEQIVQFEVPYIVIDTSSHGVLQQIALAAASQVVVPFRLEQLGMEGVYASLQMLRHAAPDAAITLVPVGYDQRIGEHRQHLQQIMEDMHGSYGLVERSAIKQRVAVMRAQAYGQSIWEYQSLDLTDVRSSYELLTGRVTRIAGEDRTHYAA